ncbi:phospholipase A [Pontiella agarivorans]|uniref:Phosphatidylcholine 1-acylhydrolase n=1 Tax=Pontiella agarivorans TaxID=3038953 RepID=A0ABU5N0V6_9BACT|nr:phospholipase A [Pontiella agarivorans]MDZ8120072.1 phospholipase A [Pontiella agarivorans]
MKTLFLATGLAVSAGAAESVFQSLETAGQGISFYQSNYAVIGADPILEAELQFSFKYRFVDEGTFDEGWKKALDNLFFAYTQTMFWDLEKDSAPYPNNYMDSYFSPEFFWRWNDFFPEAGKARVDLQFGYQHESNGRDEQYGRTWDRLNLQPTWTWGDSGNWQRAVALKIWAPLYVGEEMDDISDYYGFGELTLKTGKNDGLAGEVMLRKGSRDWNGAVELTASYPIRPVNLFVVGQLFYGYGENLRLYDEETFSYRLGVAISR